MMLGGLIGFLATMHAERARSFYGDVLGFPLISEDAFALVFDANGTTLRIQKVEQFTPHPFTALGWAVSDIARVVGELKARQVACEQFPGLHQDPDGIWRSPSGARIAWFKDPDGNVLSLTQL